MDLFQKYLQERIDENYKTDKFFVPVDKLKPKVFANALGVFGKGGRPDKVIAFCDTTFFRTGKEGYLLTKDEICHNLLSSDNGKGSRIETFNIRSLHNYVGISGYLTNADLPLDFEKVEEAAEDHEIYFEGDEKDISYIVLQDENEDQQLFYASVYFQHIKKILNAILEAKEKAIQIQNQVISAADAAYQQQAYDKAFQYYAKASEFEVARGAYMCGYMYDYGLGTVRNANLALEWYLKAAEMGDADAQLMCAVCYQLGYDGTVDMENSYRWMSRAADNGNVDAMKQCAKMCASGTGVRQNEEEALLWYENAAYSGDAEAQYMLGRAYEDGMYCKKDEAEALSWFKQAAGQNHTLAMVKCAAIYAQSNQIVKDFNQAIGYAEKAYANGFQDVEPLLNYLNQVQREEQSMIAALIEKATHGDEDAMYALVDIYLDEHGHCYDAVKGMQWMEKIADRGNAEKMIECADLYNSENIRLRNPSRAFYYYEKAARLGNCKAQFICGLACEKGEGTKQDFEKARYWYGKAADQGYPSAMHNLAILLLSGEGGERNAYASERLFRQSAAKGNSLSKEVLDKYF